MGGGVGEGDGVGLGVGVGFVVGEGVGEGVGEVLGVGVGEGLGDVEGVGEGDGVGSPPVPPLSDVSDITYTTKDASKQTQISKTISSRLRIFHLHKNPRLISICTNKALVKINIKQQNYESSIEYWKKREVFAGFTWLRHQFHPYQRQFSGNCTRGILLSCLTTVKQAIVSVETMKMRMIKLNPDFLIKAIQGKATAFASNLPSDVELLDIKYDLFAKQVLAIVRSDSFEDAADAYPTPELNLNYTNAKAQIKQETKPVAVAKPEPKPVASLKAEPATKAPAPKSQNVKAVEEEFSPEQRELLSFKADGDYVIIKPTEYLKAEWNEINEIVRSLGGKWVKGDFFSYWEIPPT